MPFMKSKHVASRSNSGEAVVGEERLSVGKAAVPNQRTVSEASS